MIKRVIPVLLIKGNGLYKTRKFQNPSYVGDPINTIKIFNDKEVDEIIILDIDASKKNLSPNFNLIKEIASECFMPLTYGGGISSIDQAAKLFNLGVEKICLQTSTLTNIELIKELISEFGSSSIAACIDIKKNFFGRHVLYSHSNKRLKLKPIELLDELNALGIGEIILQQVDNDGELKGQDLEILSEFARKSFAPIVSLGGIGSLDDLNEAFKMGANAVAAGSFFVYHGVHRAVLITYPSQRDFNRLI